ncbi:hypothetical protein L210DRAFT_2523135 [Boletus edulis BED1]|uniref:Uncharacterized protein n=1 Tax=Boletus edulis BED1 TaxID=1328754 RepID=A0AAD4BNS4_BOLED|nr:hypothetical protein L210DRAFT_2523135 [Boletus edulis BED1]
MAGRKPFALLKESTAMRSRQMVIYATKIPVLVPPPPTPPPRSSSIAGTVSQLKHRRSMTSSQCCRLRGTLSVLFQNFKACYSLARVSVNFKLPSHVSHARDFLVVSIDPSSTLPSVRSWFVPPLQYTDPPTTDITTVFVCPDHKNARTSFYQRHSRASCDSQNRSSQGIWRSSISVIKDDCLFASKAEPLLLKKCDQKFVRLMLLVIRELGVSRHFRVSHPDQPL